jgi:hypothetical protein
MPLFVLCYTVNARAERKSANGLRGNACLSTVACARRLPNAKRLIDRHDEAEYSPGCRNWQWIRIYGASTREPVLAKVPSLV